MLAIEGRTPTLSEGIKIATYPVRHPGLAAHDAEIAILRAYEEKFLVPGKVEQVHDLLLKSNIRHLGLVTDKSGTWAEDRGLPRWVGYRVSAGHITNTVIRAR